MSDEPQCEAVAADAGVVYEITIGVDGRLYCQDFGPALLPLLSAVCGPACGLEATGRAAGDERRGES